MWEMSFNYQKHINTHDEADCACVRACVCDWRRFDAFSVKTAFLSFATRGRWRSSPRLVDVLHPDCLWSLLIGWCVLSVTPSRSRSPLPLVVLGLWSSVRQTENNKIGFTCKLSRVKEASGWQRCKPPSHTVSSLFSCSLLLEIQNGHASCLKR